MLKLRQISVFGRSRDYLATQQQLIDGLATHAARVTAAKSAWERKSQAVFDDIRSALDAICSGARRCHYCEDSAADEVEHVWPKKLFPAKTFIWQNYLYACGPCNGSNKRDQFAVFDAHGNVVDIVSPKTGPTSAPQPGNPLFIDPTSEDPTAFMALDLETGLFVELHPANTHEFKRAEYTIRILGLNSRDYLIRARRSAYAGYKDALIAYSELKNSNATHAELSAKRREIGEKHHLSVWHEIKTLAYSGNAHQHDFARSPELYDI